MVGDRAYSTHFQRVAGKSGLLVEKRLNKVSARGDATPRVAHLQS